MRRAPLVLAVLALCLTSNPAKSEAGSVPHPSLKNILSSGGITVPEEWSGIWDNVDTVRTCGSPTVDNIDVSRDTLCAGDTYDPDGMPFVCTGTVTTTSFDVTCTGSIQIKTCTLEFTVHTVGTRTADTAHIVETVSQVYNPTNCLFQPDDCTETTTVATRIGAAPASCLTATKHTSWGKLKILYR